MRKTGLLGSSALRSAVFIGAALLAAPAFAQDTGTAEDPPASLQGEVEVESGQDSADAGGPSEGTIVVTGSRIRRPNLDSSVPVTSIGGEEFIQQGDTNIGEALNELPQLTSTFSQQNPGLGIGVAGLNLLDLRGLGTVRTLVLVNGRRHVASDILNNAASVDINTIPNDLIERVDIVTGAQSSIYGSDAIAGVVNFVLRRDFEGLQFRGNAAISDEGYGGEQFVSGMYGMNFGDGRGNITLHAEYNRQDRVFGKDVPEYQSVNGLAVIDTDPAGSDGFPDRAFFRDIRSATISTNAVVPITQPIGGAAPCGTNVTGSPFNCNFIFGPDGTLVPQTGTRFGTGVNGSFIGGNGQTGREGTQLSIIPEVERYTFNLLGHYEFSEALEFFVEAKYGKLDAQGSNAAPSFTQGSSFIEATPNAAGTLASRPNTQQRERIRLDNPFLSPAARATIASALLASDCDNTITGAACASDPTSGTRLSAAEEAQIAAGTYRFVIGKRFDDLGSRDEIFDREIFRVVAGLRGTFNDDWNYEVSANYGKFKEDTVQTGYVDRQRLLLSLDAADQGLVTTGVANGNIVCRAQVDPTAAYPFQSAGINAAQNAFIASRLASDIAACVPYNPFGDGRNNDAAIDYFRFDSFNHAELEQFVVSGFVSGDSSQLFELPGGPIRFALGAEYRREEALYQNDPFILNGASNAVVIGVFDPEDPLEVKEAYGEIQIPVLSDTPFFEELTFTGAGRVSDYNNAVGTVYAYNAGLEWAPIRDIRFRANYGRSVRAPNISETGFPIVPNFSPGFSDPCRGDAIGTGSATRAANCAADLGALLPNLATLGLPSLPILSGSNPELKEETSDSYTFGVVVQPRFIPGFSLSADYFDITVNDVIVSLSAQSIANNCYDAPTLDNPFCPLFERYRGPAGGGPFGEIPGQILGNSLISAGVNFAKRVRRGIDFEIAYRTNLTDDVRLNTNMIYVHNLENSNFEDPARPDFENRLLGELGFPKDEFRWDTDLTVGEVTFGYRLRYIGEQYVSVYEDFNSLNGNPPENADYADIIEYPETFYHNARIEWNIPNSSGGSDYRLYFGVDNVLNTFPPLGLTGTGAGGAGNDRATGTAAIYEALGRTFYAGFRARF